MIVYPFMNYLQQALDNLDKIDKSGKCPSHRSLAPYWQETLLQPLEDFFSRPRKDLRGQIIDMGFELGCSLHSNSPQEQKNNLEILKHLLEAIHSGSLIVDDIQDNSQVRRGDSTLHVKYGVPVALNAGNWLYFLAYSLIEKLEIEKEKKLRFYSTLTEALYGAHFGQALDVGINIEQVPREDQARLCQKSLELKSGLLMGLALKLGALLTPITEEQTQPIFNFGVQFGISLQRFDDIGNLNTKCPTPKHLEDLALKRPSWIWQYLAETGIDEEYNNFKHALCLLPKVAHLETFLKESQLNKRCFQEAEKRLRNSIQNFKQDLNLADDNIVLQKIILIGDQLTYAYR